LVCVILAVFFWVAATLAVHFLPGSITGPVSGTIGFVTAIPVGWACIRLARRVALLLPSQIAAACLLIVAVSTSIDGAAIRFLPHLYAVDEQTCRLAAAWLLWGYGVSGFAALAMAARGPSAAGPETGSI
jgi:hypothetical protein